MFTYRALRSLVTKSRPPQGRYQYGELYINIADDQLGVIDENGIAQDLLAITIFKNTAQYDAGDHVMYQGNIYIAKAAIQPGNFDPADWYTSGIDLSIADYDPALPYPAGTPAFFPGAGNCFLQAINDIPANTPFDRDMWESICLGTGGGGGGGYRVGDIVPSFFELTVDEQEERRLVPLLGQELIRTGPYADLFAVYGDKFGGNGSTTFAVPNTLGRVLRGVDPSGSVDPDGPGRRGGDGQWDAVRWHDHPAYDTNLQCFGYNAGSSSKIAAGSNWGWSAYKFAIAGKGGTADESRMRNVSVYWYAQY